MQLTYATIFTFLCICFVGAEKKHQGKKCETEKADFLKIENCTGFEDNPKTGEWNLLLLHNNDIHSRFVETDAKQNECPDNVKADNKCYGGMARIAAVVRRAREEAHKGGPPVLFLNAGDTFAGSPWFMVHKAPLVALGLNLLRPDAMCLGNHEFDLGAPGLETFMKLVYGYPVLAANINVTQEPGLVNKTSLKKSTVFNVRGHKVAVIGYVLPDSKIMAIANNITFKDEIEAIKEEIERLKKYGVKIFIGLGHSGHDMDKKIAAEVPDIDIVVGGHTNTFLWNGDEPDIEKKKGPYPVEVKQNDTDRTVPVVQAYAHTKYMGRLIVRFNKSGEVIKFCGQPLLMNNSVPRAPDVVELMKIYKGPVDKKVNEVIGKSETLNVTVCRQRECPLGILVTQAMLEAAQKYAESKGENGSDYLVLQNAGGIRNSLTPYDNGTVVYGTLMSVMPYESTLFKCQINGTQLKEMLEWGVARYENNNTKGEFPQVANMKVKYDLTKNISNRVTSLKVKCSNCTGNIFVPYNATKNYTLITSSYIAQGGDGYTTMNNASVLKENTGILDTKALADYIRNHTKIEIKDLNKKKGNINIQKQLDGSTNVKKQKPKKIEK